VKAIRDHLQEEAPVRSRHRGEKRGVKEKQKASASTQHITEKGETPPVNAKTKKQAGGEKKVGGRPPSVDKSSSPPCGNEKKITPPVRIAGKTGGETD